MMIFLKKKYKLFGFLLLGVIVSAYLMFEICQGCIFPGCVCIQQCVVLIALYIRTLNQAQSQIKFDLAAISNPPKKF